MKAKIVGNNSSHLIVDVIKVDGDLYYFDGFPSAVHKDDILEIYNDGNEHYNSSDNKRYAFGNYFRTKEQAVKVRDLIKECLIKFHRND